MKRREPWIAAVPRSLHAKCKLVADLEGSTLKDWTQRALEARLAALGPTVASHLDEYVQTCRLRDSEDDAARRRCLAQRVLALRYAIAEAIRPS